MSPGTALSRPAQASKPGSSGGPETAIGIVPARYASQRFPGKAVAPIAGVPMIVRVVEGARRAKRLRDVVVATDDERIAQVCDRHEIAFSMTSPDHPTGTDRLAEAAADLADGIVVNVQGDEPLIEGFVIDAVVDTLREHGDVPMATVVHRIDGAEAADPNRVKVVMDASGCALYFSRSPIPHARSGASPTVYQHVGLYAYRREFLSTYLDLAPTPAEQAEALEQLRVLEHGYAIRCAVIEGWHGIPVDVPEDVVRVEAALRGASA